MYKKLLTVFITICSRRYIINIKNTIKRSSFFLRHPEMSEEQRESVLEYVRRVGEAQHGRINPQNLKIPDALKLAS